MLKLLNGIVAFHETLSADRAAAFAQLALCQTPDAAFIGCSDSRVDPRIFASTDPGDVFVHRNVGNLIPACEESGICPTGYGAWAFVEFALLQLRVNHLVVCGHSECGAMGDLWKETPVPAEAPNLRKWLENGQSLVQRFRGGRSDRLLFESSLEDHNRLSQMSVLQQMDHLKGHPLVRRQMEAGALHLQGWWFDIANASVQAYDEEERRFLLIDRGHVGKIQRRLGSAL